MRGPPRFPRPMAAQQRDGPTIPTQGRQQPPGSAPTNTPRGAVPWSGREERALTRGIILMTGGRLVPCGRPLAGRLSVCLPITVRPSRARRGAAICMPLMTAMFIRTQVPAGRNMKTEAGTVSRSLPRRVNRGNPHSSNTSLRHSSVNHLRCVQAEANRCSGFSRRRKTGSGVSRPTSVRRSINGRSVRAVREAAQEASAAEEAVVVVVVVKDN